MTLSKELLRSAIEFSKSPQVVDWAFIGDLAAAARFVERLLPEQEAWDYGLVEAVKQAALDGAIVQDVSWDSNVAKIDWELVARAVLTALVGEAGNT